MNGHDPREWDWLPDDALKETNGETQYVRLNISCSNLIRSDILSKSDPIVFCYLKEGKGNWKEIGRTECIKNSHNPVFTTPIENVPYNFHSKQSIKFWVFDVDQVNHFDSKKIESKQKLGKMRCSLGKLLGSIGGTFTGQLKNAKSEREGGKIHIQCVEVGSKNNFVKLELSGHKLDKKDFLGKSDPYLRFHRINEDGTTTLVHTTEIVMENLDPVWKTQVISLGKLCSNHYNRPFLVECFDWDAHKRHDLIGVTTISIEQIQKGEIMLPLIHPKKKKRKKHYTNSGTISFDKLEIIEIPSFLDYIMSQTEIEMIVGIDYTSSNGDPSSSLSLHHFKTKPPNEYVTAIRLIGDVCAAYDQDGLIPAFGFGASLSTGTVSHCFPINFNENDPYCPGIAGVLEAYSQSFTQLSLSGPTHIAPLIKRVCSLAEKQKDGTKYFLLLIITDGTINDMGATVEAIRNACFLPISIIIVGVGGADFSNMKLLDDDRNKLRFKRDIVQFLRFRSYANSTLEQMAKDTLAEIPKQLVSYMLQNKIQPSEIVKIKTNSVPPSPDPSILKSPKVLSTSQGSDTQSSH